MTAHSVQQYRMYLIISDIASVKYGYVLRRVRVWRLHGVYCSNTSEQLCAHITHLRSSYASRVSSGVCVCGGVIRIHVGGAVCDSVGRLGGMGVCH